MQPSPYLTSLPATSRYPSFVKTAMAVIGGIILSSCVSDGPDGAKELAALPANPVSLAVWKGMVGTYSGVVNSSAVLPMNHTETSTFLQVDISGTPSAPRVTLNEQYAVADVGSFTRQENYTFSTEAANAADGLVLSSSHFPQTILLRVVSNHYGEKNVVQLTRRAGAYDVSFSGTGTQGTGTGVLQPGPDHREGFYVPQPGGLTSNPFLAGVRAAQPTVQVASQTRTETVAKFTRPRAVRPVEQEKKDRRLVHKKDSKAKPAPTPGA